MIGSFPKLRYPINTHGLNAEDRMILLAYDMIYRSKEELMATGIALHEDLKHDLDANLQNLGSHIENIICAGDLSLRFEGYDHPNMTQPIGVDILPVTLK
jgi:hypothetical protein